MEELLPENDFRLFAVCARFPQNLTQLVELTPLREGVYEVRRTGVADPRHRGIPVAAGGAQRHAPPVQRREDLLRYAQEHYRPHSQETSSLLYEAIPEPRARIPTCPTNSKNSSARPSMNC